jgi:hypothetical protein
VELPHGWHRFFVSELLTAPPGQHEGKTITPAILGIVADSDYCRLIGVAGGQIHWGWTFGDAPWGATPLTGESADPASITSHARSMKNRPVFGPGDDAGWNRKLRQLSRKELR